MAIHADVLEDPTRVYDLHTLVDRASKLWPTRVALIIDEYDESYTFSEIAQTTNKIARVLEAQGIRDGDRVGIMLPNGAEFPFLWLALAKLRATMVPLNINYQPHDASFLLKDAGVKGIVTNVDKFGILQEAIKLAGIDPVVRLVVDGEPEGSTGNYRVLVEGANDAHIERTALPEDTMNIQYTSGTTGLPKGCVLSQFYWTNMVKRMITEFPNLGEEDRLLTAQPFYYMDPQWNVTVTLLAGASLVILDRFHPSSFWEKVRQYNVSYFYCLGMMPVLMLRTEPSPLDRNHRVKAISCSAIPVHLHKELEERWGVPWYEGFGMTETGSDIGVTPEIHDELVGTGSIGLPRPNREVRIVDERDRPVPRGTPGELVLRGTGMMDGYYKNAEATAEIFRNGWLHTGDRAYMDERGFVFYIGRIKEMIRRSGENISSTEVEDVIKLHPDVKLVACIPREDEIRGEEILAFIVPKGEMSDDRSELLSLIQAAIKHCEERLAYFKVPRFWSIQADLPRTPSERIAKSRILSEIRSPKPQAYDRAEGTWVTLTN